jgi:Iap family predicted aminopeptidase
VFATPAHHDHEVVGVTDELHDRAAAAAMLDARPFRAKRCPFGSEVLVQHGQGDVEQQR